MRALAASAIAIAAFTAADAYADGFDPAPLSDNTRPVVTIGAGLLDTIAGMIEAVTTRTAGERTADAPKPPYTPAPGSTHNKSTSCDGAADETTPEGSQIDLMFLMGPEPVYFAV